MPKASILEGTGLPLCPQSREWMGNPQDEGGVGGRFPERKDAGGGVSKQLNGAMTPPPIRQRLARCVFTGSSVHLRLHSAFASDSGCHTGPLLCGFRAVLRIPSKPQQ